MAKYQAGKTIRLYLKRKWHLNLSDEKFKKRKENGLHHNPNQPEII